MTEKSHACSIGDDDVPLSWKLLFVAALCTVSAAFLFSPTRDQVDDRISDRIHWLQTSPRLADCGRDSGKSCEFGVFSFDRRGSGPDAAIVLSKDGREVASIVGGRLYVESGLNEAERTRIRSDFAKAGPH
jgi:hypothetical protein